MNLVDGEIDWRKFKFMALIVIASSKMHLKPKH